MHSNLNNILGLLVVTALAITAYVLADQFNLSPNLVAIVLGFMFVNLIPAGVGEFSDSIKWCESKALALAVALLGAQLNFQQILSMDVTHLILVLSSLCLVFLVTLLMAKIIKVQNNEALLIASGQGICGSAAILAAHGVIKGSASKTALIVALVNFLGFIGVFITIGLASFFMNDEPQSAGVLIGNSLQSMGHVVAAGFSIDDAAGHTAVLVKLSRILMLIPVLLLLIKIKGIQQKQENQQVKWLHLIPLFIWAFIILSIMASMSWIPQAWLPVLSQMSQGLFLLAMVAIGMGIKLNDIPKLGRLITLGGFVFGFQIFYSLVFLAYTQ